MHEISIVITACGKWDLTRNCLKSIAATIEKRRAEVIVIDNASNEVTQKAAPFLGKQLFGENFDYIRMDKRTSFGAAANTGARNARGEFIVFINGHIEAEQGWLEPLVDDFAALDAIGASASLVLQPQETPFGRLVENLGICITPFYRQSNLYRGIPATSHLARKRRFFQILSPDCMAVRRKIFEAAGGFGENCAEGDECVAFGAKLCEMGLRLTVNPNSRVLTRTSAVKEPEPADKQAAERKIGFPVSIRPDLASFAAADGLKLTYSAWRAFLLNGTGDGADFSKSGSGDLMAALRENPYWRKGWSQLLERDAGKDIKFFIKTFLEFFPVPESGIFAAEHCDDDRQILLECDRFLRGFVHSPEYYLAAFRKALAFCDANGETWLATQIRANLENFDSFRNEYTRFAKFLWDLENSLHVPHPPTNPESYMLWREAVDREQREEKATIARAYGTGDAAWPKFSILMPVYNPRPEHLRAALDSVLAQTYAGWELCIADDASTDPAVREILGEYARKDGRIRVEYRPENGHIAAATNSALAIAMHPWAAFMDQDDLLTPDALALMARAIRQNPAGLLFFSDEDKVWDDEFFGPHFKNGKWDWELIVSQNYVCHFMVLDIERLREIGGVAEGFPGSQDHELVLRFASGLDPAALVHVPHVLYHWRLHEQSTAMSIGSKPYALASATKAAQNWLDRHAPGARAVREEGNIWQRIEYPLPAATPAMSLVCETADAAFDSSEFYEKWRGNLPNAPEMLLVCPPEIFGELRRKSAGIAGLRVLPCPAGKMPVDLLNFGAKNAGGEILGFIAADMEPKSPAWAAEIVSCLWRPEIGAVGGKVLDRQGRLANAGYLADAGGSLKGIFAGRPDTGKTWYGWTRLGRAVDALDQLCLFTKKSLFKKLDGFKTRMDDWAAQDYCLRLGQLGLRIVWWPFAEFFHKASKHPALYRGIEIFVGEWKGRLKPFNSNLLAFGPDLQLRDPEDNGFDFSVPEYVKLYPCVGRGKLDPFSHFMIGGWREGRKGHISRIDWSGLSPDRIEAFRKSPKNGIVVCTSLCGDYERLLPPACLNNGWEYVCFSDQPREDWDIWNIREIPYKSNEPTRRSRWAKLNLPKIFPNARWIFWIDANIVIRKDLSPLIPPESGNRGLYMVRHPARTCIYEEANACLHAQKEGLEALQTQITDYSRRGMPEQFGLTENNFFLVNPRHPAVPAIFAQWWAEYEKHSKRDQISLPFVFFSQNFRPGILLPFNRTGRTCSSLYFLTHEETRWVNSPVLDEFTHKNT